MRAGVALILVLLAACAVLALSPAHRVPSSAEPAPDNPRVFMAENRAATATPEART